jgi:hypothetical protein
MLNGVPSVLTLTYISTLPSTTSTFQLSIPTPINGSVAGVSALQVPMEVTLFVKQIFLNGGVWQTPLIFIPWSQIVGITAS